MNRSDSRARSEADCECPLLSMIPKAISQSAGGEFLKQSVRYDKNVITAMIREVLGDPGGKTFVILIYYDTEYSISGFIESPTKYHYDRYRFVISAEIPTIMKRVMCDDSVPCRKHLAKHYLKWLRRRDAVRAVWAVHYWERGDGDFEGRAYYVPEHRETVFYGSDDLIKIISSARGRRRE